MNNTKLTYSDVSYDHHYTKWENGNKENYPVIVEVIYYCGSIKNRNIIK